MVPFYVINDVNFYSLFTERRKEKHTKLQVGIIVQFNIAIAIKSKD